MRRRQFAQGLAAATLSPLFARAEDAFPSRPVRLVVGLAPGGISDITARIIAPRLAEILGHMVVVENRTGAGGAIATKYVASSPPDGYTLLMAFDGTHVTIPAANPYPSAFDPVADFAPIGKVVDSPVLITAHPSCPARDFGDFIRLSRSALTTGSGPRVFDYGTAGIGSTGHLTMELLKLRLGFYAVHIPYRGGGEARAQVLGTEHPADAGGRADHGRATILVPAVLKGLAVTSAKRAAVLPNVPTLAELGFKETRDLDVHSWVGVVAPAKTPAPIVAKLDAALRQTLATEDVQTRLLNAGSTPVKSSPEIFGKQIAADLTSAVEEGDPGGRS